MRADEELGKDAVVAYAKSLGHDVRARPGDDRYKAPDYVATIDGVDFALEVTWVIDALEVPGMGLKTRADLDAGLDRLAAQIRKHAEAEGILRGHLEIGLDGYVINNLRKRSEGITARFLDFLRQGPNDERTARIAIDKHGDELVHVGYFTSWPAGVFVNGSGVTYDEWIVPAVREGLEERISEKRRLLEHERRPKILALIGLYASAWDGHYQRAFAGIPADDFTAVVVVHPPERVTVLSWRVPPPLASQVL